MTNDPLILSEQIRFRKIEGWQQIIEVVCKEGRHVVEKKRSVG